VGRWHEKREDLRKHLAGEQRGLRLPRPTRSPRERATTAECVFNVNQAVTQVAALASNIADSAKTCVEGGKYGGIFNADKGAQTQGATCVVNLAGISYSISFIAGSLSMAAQNCATTLVPNVDALCSAALTGIGAQVSQLGGGAALTAMACDPKGKAEIPRDAVPSKLGQPQRRLSAVNQTDAPARRLVFGGGYSSDGTQCYVDTSSIAWWLAQAGLAINAAANHHAGASCPTGDKPKKSVCRSLSVNAMSSVAMSKSSIETPPSFAFPRHRMNRDGVSCFLLANVVNAASSL